MNINMKDGHVLIDGREFRGRNVTIKGNNVFVDGVEQSGELVGDIHVTVHGDVEHIETQSGTIRANNVGNIQTTSGDIECGDVRGSIQTVSGDIDCKNVSGSIRTVSGDISR